MTADRISFTFRNLEEEAVAVVIEPWAVEEVVPAGAVMVLEVNANPAPEMEFSLTENGRPFIYVASEHITIHVAGELRHTFQLTSRPPPVNSFHVLNRLLWGKADRET